MEAIYIKNDRPTYKVLNEKGFFGPDDHLYGPGEIIEFDDEPNEDMEPMNLLAREAMEKYITKLEDCGRAAAEKAGRPYVGRAKNLEEAISMSTEDARRVQSISNPTGVPVMKSDKRTKNTGISRVTTEAIPETGGRGKLSIKNPRS